MKLRIFTVLCISLLMGSCDSKTHNSDHNHSSKHHTDHNKSNQHMNTNSFEELSKAFEDKERENWQKPDLVIEKLGDIKGKKIGDIGAGTGYFSFRMANIGANVTAIDVDERFQDFIKQKIEQESTTNLKLKLVGYDDPELSQNEFDCLLIVNTYHHFNDKIEYMTYCYNGLKEGGTLMNVDFKYKETAHGPPVDHRISAEEVKNDLLEVGFVDVKIDQSTLSEQYIITARKETKMEKFWNNRYADTTMAYGKKPNEFFKSQIKELEIGKMLLPAEGEGRNAVYSAILGWEVSAFDISHEGKKKADLFAEKSNVSIEYIVGGFDEVIYEEESFDCIGLIYAHFPAHLRSGYHKMLDTYLQPGGIVILEGFSKDHLALSAENPEAGGPKNMEMLFSMEEIKQDFSNYEIIELTKKEVLLEEGLYHNGKSSVIRFVGRKK